MFLGGLWSGYPTAIVDILQESLISWQVPKRIDRPWKCKYSTGFSMNSTLVSCMLVPNGFTSFPLSSAKLIVYVSADNKLEKLLCFIQIMSYNFLLTAL